MTIGHVIENAMITKAKTIYTTKSTFNKIFSIDLMLHNQILITQLQDLDILKSNLKLKHEITTN